MVRQAPADGARPTVTVAPPSVWQEPSTSLAEGEQLRKGAAACQHVRSARCEASSARLAELEHASVRYGGVVMKEEPLPPAFVRPLVALPRVPCPPARPCLPFHHYRANKVCQVICVEDFARPHGRRTGRRPFRPQRAW